MRLNAKTILLILVVFLLGINIAVVMTYHNHLQGEKLKTENKIPDSQFGRFFNDQLNLNKEQQDSFREFRRKYNRLANQKLSEMQEIRTRMADALKSTQPDRKTLDKLAEKLGEKHRELKGLTFDYYFNMQSVLNGEQKMKMVDLFQDMLTETGDAKKPAQGGQGQGRGRNQGWKPTCDTVPTTK